MAVSTAVLAAAPTRLATLMSAPSRNVGDVTPTLAPSYR
jgi:hypothetical protein